MPNTPDEDFMAAMRDSKTHGTGFTVDGKHVSPERVQMFTPTATHGVKTTLDNALRRSQGKAASDSVLALLERFEDAVREDEMKGAYDPISRHLAEMEYQLSKTLLITALKGGAA